MSNMFDQFDEEPTASSGNMFDQFDEAPSQGTAAIPDNLSANEPGFLERSWNTATDTFDKMTTHEGLEGSEFGNDPMSRTREALNEGVAGASSILGDFVMSAGKAVLPEEAQEWIGDKAQAVAQSEPVQAVARGVGEFAEAHPNEAKELGETLNIATAFAGGPKIAGNKAAGEVLTPGAPSHLRIPVVDKMAKEGVKRNQKGVALTRKEKVTEMLMPEDVKSGAKGDLELDTSGRKVWKPGPHQEAVIDTARKVKGLNPKKSALHNNTVLKKEVTRVREQLERVIERKGNPAVDLKKLDMSFQNAVDDLKASPMLQGDAEKTALALIEKMRKEMKSDKALDVLQARRNFDKAIKREVGDMAFNPDRDSAVNVAMNRIREAVNNAVDDAVPNVDVKDYLTKQHHLLSAKDIVFKKAWKEADSNVGRIIHGIEDKFGFKFPTTPLAIGATATGAGGAAAALAGMPVVATALTGLTGAYAAGKGVQYLMSPSGRTALWKAVKAIADDPLMSKKLNTERLLLVDLLESTKDSPLEEDE